ncbi:hypothetical protein Scep_020441 [Stephania cephalantha]|uniref:Uncharacterized protein n=1 Tax=Stephania cephalantha TaxID=152367 RepID=A0AAP0IDW8_9MAGN
MEESEKRRERPKAMRMEAAQANALHNEATSTVPAQLSNSLIDSSTTMEHSSAHTRFDFYTDPMAAFSSNKRIKETFHDSPPSMPQPLFSHFAGPRNFDMSTPPPPPPPLQFQIGHSPLPYQGPGPWQSPVRMTPPPLGHPGASPGVWNQSGGTASYGFSPKSPRLGGYPSPGFRRGGSYSGSSNSGRSSGGRFTNSSSSPHWGRGGGRGRGFHASVSARERPGMFYSKSMIEDPWRSLIPIVKNLSISAGSQSTLVL